MTRRLLVEDGIGALRAALLEDGALAGIFWLTEDDPPLEAIHLARITDIRPELGGAFADIGEGLSGFLPDSSLPQGASPVQAGQRLPLQVAADPGPDKALRLTAKLRAMGRYVTLSAGGTGLRPKTAARDDPALAEGLAGVTCDHALRLRIPPSANLREAIIAEAASLRGRLQAAPLAEGAPRQLVGPPDPLQRVLRAAPHDPELRIRVDSRPLQTEISRLARRWPDLAECVHLEAGGVALFDEHGVSDVLEALLAGEMTLPSGGRLRLAETPAAHVIDVDSGSADAAGSAATLRRQTNLEAAAAIARLLPLARIGGLIVVDFLNMDSARDRTAVQTALHKALARDAAAPHCAPINSHGVLTITRPHSGPSLRARLLRQPPARPGLAAQGHDLLCAALRRAARPGAAATLILAAPPALADWLEQGDRLARLAARGGCAVRLERLDDADADAAIRTA